MRREDIGSAIENVFKFNVRTDMAENKHDWIRFVCGNGEKLILAKYEK